MIESSEEEPYPHHTAWVSRCGWNIERMHAYRKTPFDTFFEIAICLYSYRPTRFPFIPSVSALVPRKALGVCMYEYSRSSIYGIHTYVHHKVHTRITTYTYIRSVELNFEGWQELGQSNCEQRAVGWAVCCLLFGANIVRYVPVPCTCPRWFAFSFSRQPPRPGLSGPLCSTM